MLVKNRRLTTSLLKNVFASGKSIFGQEISLVYIKRQDTNPTRFAFSVSSKAVKTAVMRNRIRRVGYTSLSSFLSEVKPSFDVVFIVKKPLDLTIFDLKSSLVSLLKKTSII